MAIGTDTKKDSDGEEPAPRRAWLRGRRRDGTSLSRTLWALAVLATVLLALGAATSRALAVSGALLLAGCTVALLLAGFSRVAEIEGNTVEERRRVGVRATVRIALALAVVSVACASVLVGWNHLAIASSVVLCVLALVGGPTWLAGVGEAEESPRAERAAARK